MNKRQRKKAVERSMQPRHRPWKRDKQREATLPLKPLLTKEEMVDYKRQMKKVISYTNAKIDQTLDNHIMTTQLYDFLNGDTSKRFAFDDKMSAKQLRAYMTQVRVVLESLDDDGRKATLDTALMEAEAYRGQFGNQHNAVFTDEIGKARVRHYNTRDVFDENGNLIRRAISPDLASRAFAAYRRLEVDYAGYIGRQGQELMFGSENLIILLYDFYEKNPGADYNFNTDHDTMDAQMFASELLERWIEDKLLELEGINFNLSSAPSIITSWDDYLNTRLF